MYILKTNKQTNQINLMKIIKSITYVQMNYKQSYIYKFK